MSIYKTDDIIGWQNDQSEFLCPKCFEEKHEGEESIDDWYPVDEKEQNEYTFICDHCGCRIRV